jgi:hypothetical protein
MVLYSSKTKMVRARENATWERVTLVAREVMMRERVTMMLGDGVVLVG